MLDQDIVNLAKAIREHETGNRPVQGSSGELASRYQYLPSTWKSTASRYLGDPNAPLTLENENKATYLKLKDWKDAGYNPAQIASMWNSGQPEWEGKVGVNKYGVNYDVPAYVNSVYSKYRQLKNETQPVIQAVEEKPEPKKTGLWYKIKETAGDIKDIFTGSSEALGRRSGEATEAISQSLKGEIDPITAGGKYVASIANLFNDIAGELYTGIGKILVSQETEDQVKEDVMDVLENSGAVDALQKGSETWQEWKEKNPTLIANIETIGSVGLATVDVLGAGKIGTVAKDTAKRTLRETVSGAKKALGLGEKAVKGAGRQIAEKAPIVTKYGVSQATGLAPETITKVINSPEEFTLQAIKNVDREVFAKNAISKIENRIEALKDTGKTYQAIRESGATVELNDNFFDDVLKNRYGFNIEDGKITATTKSATRNASDINAIQTLYDNWSPSTTNRTSLDADEFLNLRADLADLAKYDATRSKASQDIARGLRNEINTKYRGQIEGLKELDEAYGTEVKFLNDIKKDYFKKDGGLKDNAISKLANLTGKGKEQALERLKGIIPDVEKQVNIIKAIEDIRYAGGQKVGTYTRTAFGAGGVLTGNVPLIIGSLLSTPQIAVQLLRQYGAIKKISKELIEATIKSVESGKKLVGKQLQLVRDMINDKSQKFINYVKELKNNEKGFQKLPFSPEDVQLGDTIETLTKKLKNTTDGTAIKRLEKQIDELEKQRVELRNKQ